MATIALCLLWQCHQRHSDTALQCACSRLHCRHQPCSINNALMLSRILKFVSMSRKILTHWLMRRVSDLRQVNEDTDRLADETSIHSEWSFSTAQNANTKLVSPQMGLRPSLRHICSCEGKACCAENDSCGCSGSQNNLILTDVSQGDASGEEHKTACRCHARA